MKKEDFEKINIPCGSEGSIQYEIIQNPEIGHVDSYRVQIWGDLRDYDDYKEIKNWFEKILNKLWIRSAVLQIDIEEGSLIILSLDSDGKLVQKNL